jgi:hypothetical protein
MANLPEGAKSAVSGVWEKGVADMKVLAEKVMKLPGVESVLKPAVTQLMDKLEAVGPKKGSSHSITITLRERQVIPILAQGRQGPGSVAL